MIIHSFIISSAVQIYEFSYIHYQYYRTCFNPAVFKNVIVKLIWYCKFPLQVESFISFCPTALKLTTLHLTIFLFYCQLFICVSTLLSKIPCQSEYWLLFVSILFLFGQWGSRCWTAMVAFSLCLVRCKGDNTVKKFKLWIWLFGFGWV